MFKHVEYVPEGVCSRKISFDIVDGYIHHVTFDGGCAGNTRGVSMLAEGRWAEDLVAMLKGTACHDGHSCPDSFARAIEEALAE